MYSPCIYNGKLRFTKNLLRAHFRQITEKNQDDNDDDDNDDGDVAEKDDHQEKSYEDTL